MLVKLIVLTLALGSVTSCGILKSDKSTDTPPAETICTILVDSKIDEKYQATYNKAALGSDPLKFSVQLKTTETSYVVGFQLNNLVGSENALDLGDEIILKWSSAFPKSALKEVNTLDIYFEENNLYYPLWKGPCRMNESIKTSAFGVDEAP